MDKVIKRPLAILNLTDELSSELANYFSKKEITLIPLSEWNESIEISHILMKGFSESEEIEEKYKVTEKDIKLISLAAVDSLEKFITHNGRLVFNEIWLETKLGEFILDKFIQEYAGVEIEDSYPNFQEKGAFNITNPFNTGEYLDRLVYDAYEDGFSALAIKTYFDHLIMYLTILKNDDKAGFPFEVSYGEFEEVFGVQLHFFSKNVTVQDLLNSLSTQITKGSHRYLLNIATQSADFFDFSYLAQVNKIVITALWAKDKKIQEEAGGVMIGELSGASELSSFPSTGDTSFLIQEPPHDDISDMVVLEGRKEEEEEEAVQVISGGEEEEELVQVIKGTMEEAEEIHRIPGQKFDVDDFTYKIAAGVQDKSKEGNLKVKSLSNNLQQTLKEGLFDFAKNITKTVDDLDSDDMETFKNTVIPALLAKKAESAENNKKLENSPKDKLVEQRLAQLTQENEKLKSKLGTLMTEVRAQTEAKKQMEIARNKALEEAEKLVDTSSSSKDKEDDDLRSQLLNKSANQTLEGDDLKKLQALLEKDKETMETIKQEAIRAKKIQIEAAQKETMFTKELEKTQREIKAKDLMLTKTKEMVAQLTEKKDAEINDFKVRLDMANKALSSGASEGLVQQVRDLEKQSMNQIKMIDMYKEKISTLSASMESNRSDDGNSKDEARKAQILNTQLKNQLDVMKRDFLKLQERSNADNSMLTNLKAEKAKLEIQVKKAASDIPKEAAAIKQLETELKRVQGQCQLLEAQFKEATSKAKDFETRLIEASKVQKVQSSGDDGAKVKVTQLENSLKKLTQDLMASQNQLAEMKKEVNKSRQEKTALQNQIDKLKKDAEKTAKKTAPPGGTPPAKAA